MTDQELAAIRTENEARKSIKAKASPGPWATDYDNRGNGGYFEWWNIETVDKRLGAIYVEDNAAFVVHARNDAVEETIDRLLAEVKELRAALDAKENEYDSDW